MRIIINANAKRSIILIINVAKTMAKMNALKNKQTYGLLNLIANHAEKEKHALMVVVMIHPQLLKIIIMPNQYAKMLNGGRRLNLMMNVMADTM